jgi:hypothetical protein
MNLRNLGEWIRVDDYVSVSVSDYGWGSDTYEGIVIDTNNGITVLFTDGDVCRYGEWSKLKTLNWSEGLRVGEKIIKVLKRMNDQKEEIDKQRDVIKSYLLRLK